jgi:predicted GIY-YIG superfamily endonuclease
LHPRKDAEPLAYYCRTTPDLASRLLAHNEGRRRHVF